MGSDPAEPPRQKPVFETGLPRGTRQKKPGGRRKPPYVLLTVSKAPVPPPRDALTGTMEGVPPLLLATSAGQVYQARLNTSVHTG